MLVNQQLFLLSKTLSFLTSTLRGTCSSNAILLKSKSSVFKTNEKRLKNIFLKSKHKFSPWAKFLPKMSRKFIRRSLNSSRKSVLTLKMCMTERVSFTMCWMKKTKRRKSWELRLKYWRLKRRSLTICCRIKMRNLWRKRSTIERRYYKWEVDLRWWERNVRWKRNNSKS